MLDSGERGDVFNCSVDCLSWFDEESGIGVWRSELKSVKERREAFFCKMGFDYVSDLGDSYMAESVGVELDTFGNEAVENPVWDENGKANTVVDESETDLSCGLRMGVGVNLSASVSSKAKLDCWKPGSDKKRACNWWKKIVNKKVVGTFLSKVPGINTTKVQARKKAFKELSALYTGQRFQAHKGVIWTAKFSPSGEFLATADQDGVVRVWCVTSADAHEKRFLDHGDCKQEIKGAKIGLRIKKTGHVPVMITDRAYAIKESPVHEFQGHAGHILDLAWSNSNLILSSSSDGTVRLWQVGSNECLGVFRHSDSVTCVQFNPTDAGYFVTGSIDGMIRIWRVSEGRVVDWDDVREAVTALAYQPDGQGLVAGSLQGLCRFYETSGFSIHLSTQIQIRGSKRSGSRVTGIQFCPENPQRVMITSDASKIRVFDKININMIKTYRGLPKSGAQLYTSFTLNPKHLLSVGEESRVFLWDYNSDQHPTPSKHSKSIRSCQYFHSQGASVTLPLCSYKSASEVSSSGSRCVRASCGRPQGHRDCEHVSFAKWFSVKGTSTNWPEEMLPLQAFHHGVEKEWRKVFHNNYGLLPIKV